MEKSKFEASKINTLNAVKERLKELNVSPNDTKLTLDFFCRAIERDNELENKLDADVKS